MSDWYKKSKENLLDFKQICLLHYQKILDLTTKEFIGGYWNCIYSGNVTNKTYVSDSRAEFCQAVESLSNSLFPYFDSKMKTAYDEFEKEDKEISGKYLDEVGLPKDDECKVKYSVMRLQLMKTMFREISCLMFRLNYFKSESYSEGDDDDDIFDVDEKEEDNGSKSKRRKKH